MTFCPLTGAFFSCVVLKFNLKYYLPQLSNFYALAYGWSSDSHSSVNQWVFGQTLDGRFVAHQHQSQHFDQRPPRYFSTPEELEGLLSWFRTKDNWTVLDFEKGLDLRSLPQQQRDCVKLLAAKGTFEL